ncbi:MAG: hypothetical protein A2096_04685 [Spirochaetes bacterium GWF1_41_5]|nr:MAG: hypothetical protein A2096_04685 [Spirochaetes bacterium GWF1_41_5]HBE02251.1 hypothetical protein [Spirochaetia bacterium]
MLGIILIILFPAIVFCWGGPEHEAITSAAVRILDPQTAAFFGVGLYKLVKMFCKLPDMNWQNYGSCIKKNNNCEILPDTRRDWNISYYCEFDELTGKGSYFLHGPEIGNRLLSMPDERSTISFEKKLFGHTGVHFFLKKACTALDKADLYSSHRYIGIALHYLEDSTPPPHTLGIEGGSNPLHHAMEKINNPARITAGNYKPEKIAGTVKELCRKAAQIAADNAREAQNIARQSRELVESGKINEAEMLSLRCAEISARAAADILFTVAELYKKRKFKVKAGKGNLVKNPSLALDSDYDGLPDNWVREWTDTRECWEMHRYDRVSMHSGRACLKMFNTSAAGVSWRTNWDSAIIHFPGKNYSFSGWVRTEGATGENIAGVRCMDDKMNCIKVFFTENYIGTEKWKKFSLNFKPPAETAELLLYVSSKNNQGSVLFDDFLLHYQ